MNKTENFIYKLNAFDIMVKAQSVDYLYLGKKIEKDLPDFCKRSISEININKKFFGYRINFYNSDEEKIFSKFYFGDTNIGLNILVDTSMIKGIKDTINRNKQHFKGNAIVSVDLTGYNPKKEESNLEKSLTPRVKQASIARW